MNCLLTDVIKTTLASCDYTMCNQLCMDYIINVGYNCPLVFNNDVYTELWQNLFAICSKNTELSYPMIGH
jgi:DNA recombination-dependent growth factor C